MAEIVGTASRAAGLAMSLTPAEASVRSAAPYWRGEAMPTLEGQGRAISPFEFWPPLLFYLPIVLCWILLALRHRSLTLPTLANPRLEAGGLCGESKAASLAMLGPEGRARLAPFAMMSTQPVAAPEADLAAALAAAAACGLDFPLVAKPDIGCRGTGVRVVADSRQLGAYLAEFPRGERVMLQRLVPDEGEAGVFYLRKPGAARGRIVSLTLKYFPRLVGDGRATVEELIRADPRAGAIPELYLKRHERDRGRVLGRGEVFRLTLLGNHCRGAVFRDGAAFVTAEMETAFDRIAREMDEFHLGRFDVRFRSLGDLMRGAPFSIIEFNGVGSEATHIWDRDATLRSAYAAWFAQLADAFAIGAANRARGFAPMKVLDLLGLYRRQQKLMKAYPR
ncbi:MAG: D-alanine--D-alanine ligase [Alphaproteobacteria bacterium]|nr:D-alanine--D-alanine ligase [Alphaproteobacteria bacterium]